MYNEIFRNMGTPYDFRFLPERKLTTSPDPLRTLREGREMAFQLSGVEAVSMVAIRLLELYPEEYPPQGRYRSLWSGLGDAGKIPAAAGAAGIIPSNIEGVTAERSGLVTHIIWWI
jgi:hypothetical protein